MVIWKVIVCFISVHIGVSLGKSQQIPTSSCQPAPGSSIISGESTTTKSKEGCSIAPQLTALPQNLQNPRYTRSILAATSRVPRNLHVVRLRVPREIHPGKYNQNPANARVMQAEQKNIVTPQGNFDYRPNGQELSEKDGGSPQQEYSSQFYPTYDGSFTPPTSHRDQLSAMNFNQEIPPIHAFGARSCPFCNSPLPPGFDNQPKQVVPPRPNQFHRSPQHLSNQFNPQPQYATLHRPASYQNVNAGVKTTPTILSEEMCPYDNGSPPQDHQISPISGYNQTLPQIPDVRGPPRVEKYPPSIANNPPYLAAKNLQAFAHGQQTPKNMKVGASYPQTFKYMKMQRAEDMPRNIDRDT